VGRAAHSKNLYIAVDVKHAVRITVTLFLPVMVRETIQWTDVIPIERASGPGALSGREQWAGDQVIWRISPLPNFVTGSVLWVNVLSPSKNCWIASRPFEYVRHEDRVGEIRPLQVQYQPSKGLEMERWTGTSETLSNWGKNFSSEIVCETDIMRLCMIGVETGWYCPVYRFYFKVSDLSTLGLLAQKHRKLTVTSVITMNTTNCL